VADLLYHGKPVLLDRQKHRALRVRAAGNHAFAREANALPLAAAEFGDACREYAIVYTRSGGKLLPVAALGLRTRENLFVDEEGRWDAKYLPAFVRRYPFVLAELPGQSLALCIDETYPGFGTDEGEPLFDASGADTPVLRHALDFLALYQREHLRTEAFCRRLEEAGLLVEMDARADLVDGRSFTVNGLLVVDEKKLLALPDAAVLALFRSGDLHLVSLHLASLANLQGLVDRLASRKAAMSPAPQPTP
jgi:hypothetical protein